MSMFRPRRASWLALVLLAACSQSPAPEPAAADAAPAAPTATTAAPAAPVDEAGLRAAISDAMTAQRIYAPAGDNAIEHYLALRELRGGDAGVDTALLELLPYAVIGGEQAMDRGDFTEAARLLALVQRVDADAPALPRLRDSLAAAETAAAARVVAEAEATALRERQEAERAQAAATAAASAANTPAASPPPVAALAAATPPPASAPVAAPAPAPVAAAPVTPPPAAAHAPSAPAAAASRIPALVSAPQPRYPVMAQRRKIEGEVTVEITIQPDGSVGNTRVLSAQPAGTFDEAALAAAKRWRFERGPAPVTTSRVVRFRLAEAAD